MHLDVIKLSKKISRLEKLYDEVVSCIIKMTEGENKLLIIKLLRIIKMLRKNF